MNNRPPAQVIDLEQSAKAQHESRHAADQVLRDRHRDQNEDAEPAIRKFANCRRSEALSVHVFGKVVGPLSIASLEGKIYFSRCGKNVAQFCRRRSVSERAFWWSRSNIVIEAAYLEDERNCDFSPIDHAGTILSEISMTERVAASRFPEADVYFCDKCGRDVTRRFHRGQAHVRQPIGPMRYTCDCGETYLTGATEWDYLSDWDKRQWRADAGLAVILFVLILIPVALGYMAWHRRSAVLLAVFVAVLTFAVVGLRLFGLILVGFLDIARSIWRTRFMSAD